MQRIYKNQTSLLLRVHTGADLEGLDQGLLKYIKPDGTEGSFDLTAEEEDRLIYNVEEDDIDQSGPWTFWVHLTFIDGRSVPGDPVEIYIYEEGET